MVSMLGHDAIGAAGGSLAAPRTRVAPPSALDQDRGHLDPAEPRDTVTTGSACCPPPSTRDWTFIVFKVAGHGLKADYVHDFERLAQGSGSRANIVVRTDMNGPVEDFVIPESPGPAAPAASRGLSARVGTREGQPSIRTRESMGDFIVQAMRRFPARHYLVAFDGHSEHFREVIPAIQGALSDAVQENSGRKLDLLLFDSCFMAQVETASEFQDVASHLVASQEGVYQFRDMGEMAGALDRDSRLEDPAHMARHVVETSEEFAMSAVDLDKVPALNGLMKRFGDEILKVTDDDELSALRRAVRKSQHFSTEGVFSPNSFYNTVDICDFAGRVASLEPLRYTHPSLVEAARQVAKHLEPADDGVVYGEKHQSGDHRYLLDYTNVDRAHGLSMHLPTTPAGLRETYTHFEGSRFDAETGWERVISHLTSSKNIGYKVQSLALHASGQAVSVVNGWLYNAAYRAMEKDERDLVPPHASRAGSTT